MLQRVAQAIRHIGFEDLGSFAVPVRSAGYSIEYVDVAERNRLPLDPLRPDLLVVLGGPLAVYDRAAYPVVDWELDLLATRLSANKPTLGICLGAQMIAAALGSQVVPGLHKEIGWAPLDLTDVGKRGPLGALRDTPVLHWHGDTFDLPDGCDLLASTDLCRNQAFSRGPNVLGLQFHAEPLASKIEYWLLGHAFELGAASRDPAILRADAERYGKPLEDAGATMVARWLDSLV